MRIILLFMLLINHGSVYALETEAYHRMIRLYQQAVAGDADARDDVKVYLEQLSDSEPENALVMVYKGSVMTLEGRDAWMPWNKIKYTEKGMDLMEQALNMRLDSKEVPTYLNHSLALEIKMLCAITFTQVPKMFGRFEQGLELIDAIVTDKRYQQLSESQRAHLIYYRAEAAIKEDLIEDARNYYKKVLGMKVDDEIRAKAKEALGRL